MSEPNARSPHTVDEGGGISVVIPHFGDPDVPAELLRRLGQQVLHRALDVILVDDCSPTPFHWADPSVRVVRADRNGGFGSAVNLGARAARQPLLLILNSDLRPDPHFVEDFVAGAAAHLPAILSPQLIEGGRPGPTAYRTPRVDRLVLDQLRVLRRGEGTRIGRAWGGSDPGCQPGTVATTSWVAGACLLVRRQDFLAVGGFDEGFFMYWEDADLCRRLAGIGVPTVFLGGLSVDHAQGGSTTATRAVLWNATSRLRYARRWGYRRRLVAGLAAASVANLLTDLVGSERLSPRAALGRFRGEAGLLRTAVRAERAGGVVS